MMDVRHLAMTLISDISCSDCPCRLAQTHKLGAKCVDFNHIYAAALTTDGGTGRFQHNHDGKKTMSL